MNISKDDAVAVTRMADSDGFKILLTWINGRINTLSSRVLSGESDISVESVVKQKTVKKIDITVLNLSKDSDRHEIKTWKLLLSKILEYEKMAI